MMKKKYDPLFNLYQIEPEETYEIDQEVVGLMAEILYNIEDINEIRRDIIKLMNNKNVANERCLSLIKTMIDALEAELSILGLLGFNVM
jgi:hypothetical protein